jgi:putative ABC transport system permease protein
VINSVLSSEIAIGQLADPDTDIFTGIAFETEAPTVQELVMQHADTLPEEERMPFLQGASSMTEEELYLLFGDQLAAAANRSTYERNRERLGIVDFASPSSISLYPRDFASKEGIAALIEDYNEAQRQAGLEDAVIHYTDIVGLMTSGISSIINVTSYVLIAFVSISLIVSSIMIAIITYISVLERTKEIGILRSIGAAKRDISRVFNAETLIEGFVAGVLGIGITLLLNIPANTIIKNLTDISGLSRLPPLGAAMLIVLSMFLTVLAGFIPSKMAAKKDPVVALRAE